MNTGTNDTSPIEDLDLCVAGVVQSACRFVIEKDYEGVCGIDPLSIVTLAFPLRRDFRATIEQVSLELTVDDVERETHVLEPTSPTST